MRLDSFLVDMGDLGSALAQKKQLLMGR